MSEKTTYSSGANVPEPWPCPACADVRKELHERIQARDRVFAAFGHDRVRGPDGECICPYCTQDGEALAEMTAEYELRSFGLEQKLEAAKAQLAAQGEALTQALPWQPIESAPKDGDTLMVYAPTYAEPIITASWDRDTKDECGQCWRASDALSDRLEPTHWLSLRAIPRPGEQAEAEAAGLRTALEQAQAELKAQAEFHSMQLAAVSTAALSNTRTTAAEQMIPRDNVYWSPAYGDTVKAVEREMAHREAREQAEAEAAGLRAQVQALRDDIRSMERVAGQASVEGNSTAGLADQLMSNADARFASYCSLWANRLDALLSSVSLPQLQDKTDDLARVDTQNERKC